MRQTRALLHRHAWLAVLLLVATVWLKALVPAGYMLDASGPGQTITVRICNGAGMSLADQTVTLPGVERNNAPATGGSSTGSDSGTAPCHASAVAFGLIDAVSPTLGERLTPSTPRLIAGHEDFVGVGAGLRLRPPLRAPPYQQSA